MTQHTQGSWEAEPWADDSTAVVAQDDDANDGYVICVMQGPDAQANARLIAAAPQLLAALQRVMSYPAVRNALECDDNDAALAAIAAATGTPT